MVASPILLLLAWRKMDRRALPSAYHAAGGRGADTLAERVGVTFLGIAFAMDAAVADASTPPQALGGLVVFCRRRGGRFSRTGMGVSFPDYEAQRRREVKHAEQAERVRQTFGRRRSGKRGRGHSSRLGGCPRRSPTGRDSRSVAGSFTRKPPGHRGYCPLFS